MYQLQAAWDICPGYSCHRVPWREDSISSVFSIFEQGGERQNSAWTLEQVYPWILCLENNVPWIFHGYKMFNINNNNKLQSLKIIFSYFCCLYFSYFATEVRSLCYLRPFLPGSILIIYYSLSKTGVRIWLPAPGPKK